MFLQAIEVRHEWDASRPLLPWLWRILHNRARGAPSDRPDARGGAAAGPSRERPARAAESAEFDAAVDEAIAALPEIYQPVLRLHLAYTHGQAEIAHALGRPPGTVRSQLAHDRDRAAVTSLVMRATDYTRRHADLAVASWWSGYLLLGATAAAQAPRAVTQDLSGTVEGATGARVRVTVWPRSPWCRGTPSQTRRALHPPWRARHAALEADRPARRLRPRVGRRRRREEAGAGRREPHLHPRPAGSEEPREVVTVVEGDETKVEWRDDRLHPRVGTQVHNGIELMPDGECCRGRRSENARRSAFVVVESRANDLGG